MKLEKRPLLSIIVPVYNVAEHLPRCIESILKQTYAHLEIILVDDGSPDNSGKICDDYAQKDSRIKVVHQENRGLSGARNTGLEMASGDYIGFVDSDDWIKKTMFEEMVNVAIGHNVDMVTCGVIKSLDLQNEDSPNEDTIFFKSRDEAIVHLIETTSFSVWRRIYRNSLIQNIKFVEGKNSEDVYFTLESLMRLEKCGYTEKELYIYNVENESITRGAYSLKKLDSIDAAEFLYHTCKNQNTTIKKLASNYLLRSLLKHYMSLFTNKELDPKFKIRKALKSKIRLQSKIQSKVGVHSYYFFLQSLAIRLLPNYMYGQIVSINNWRLRKKLS